MLFKTEVPLENPFEKDMYIYENDLVNCESEYEYDAGNSF